MEHPPDVFVLGRVFYAHIADKRGSYASLFFRITEPEELRQQRRVKAVT